MNKILRIDAPITAACPNLVELILSDNLLKQIDAGLFAKGPGADAPGGARLQVLDLSINQL